MPSPWKSIRALIIGGVLLIALLEGAFIANLRADALGRHGVDYGVAFSREKYLLAHRNDPCPLAPGQEAYTPELLDGCRQYTERQLALYRTYHQYFWEDVWTSTRAFLFGAFALLAILCVWILMNAIRNRNTLYPSTT